MATTEAGDPVPTAVVKDVVEGVAHLSRAAQDHVVVTLLEHPTLPVPDPVQRSSDTGLEADHPAHEVLTTVGFDHQVHVITEHRELRQAKAPHSVRPELAAGEGSQHCSESTTFAHAGDFITHRP